jgi:hypothetical protein
MNPWVLAAFAALSVSTAPAACQPGAAEFSQAGGRLDEALQTLAQRTGCSVEVAPELLSGRLAAPAQGSLTPSGALAELLRGTGLEGRESRDGLTVDRRDQAAVLAHTDRLLERLEQAVAERRLSQARANRWRSALHTVRRGVQQDARRRGFVGSAELEGYGRTLAGVEQELGRLPPNR